jgi:hypothetical protein
MVAPFRPSKAGAATPQLSNVSGRPGDLGSARPTKFRGLARNLFRALASSLAFGCALDPRPTIDSTIRTNRRTVVAILAVELRDCAASNRFAL